MFLLPLAIAIALGFACVRLLWPGGLRPCRHDWLKLWLGIGIGLGVHSAIYFLFRRTGVLIAVELVLLALLGLGVKGCAECAEPPVPVQPRAKYSALLALLFWSIAACSLATFVLFCLGGPHGEWDAWTIWNMHARAMFRDAGHFRDLFTKVMARSHPDYPPLIPASIAATWCYIGEDSIVVPSAIALLFTLATAGVLVSAVSWLRSPMQGHLAGILLLGAASFVRFGSSQYADVPFSFYVVATLAMLAFSHRDPEASRYPVLAGILASERLTGFSGGEDALTFGQFPVAMAAAVATLDAIVADDLCKNAREMGEYATQRLLEMMGHRRLIGDVRGPGLFVSLELVTDRETKEPALEAAAEVYRLGVQRGVLFGENRYAGLGNLIKIKPPLDVTHAQMSHALDVLDEVLGTIEQSLK